MVKVYYSPQYVGSGYAFDTTRKAQWIADSLLAAPIKGIELVEPTPLTPEQVAEVHDPEYVQAVLTGKPRHLAESQGFTWDAGLAPMVLASNGGAVAAALTARKDGVAGSLSSGLHHAKPHSGDGFCTFNGLAIAANEVLKVGVSSLLILDFDAHCGGGTASLIRDDSRVWQLDVSVSSFDVYPSSERLALRIVRNSRDYLGVIESELAELATRLPEVGLCLYNAGMDPFEGCSTGGLEGISYHVLARRERIVFDWCREHKIPIAFVLAGGYVGRDLDQAGLVALHRLTLSAAVA